MGLIRMSRAAVQRWVAGIRQQQATPVGAGGAIPIQLRKPPRHNEVAFELTEEIPEVHLPATEYGAHIRDWDPSQGGGVGAYVTGTTDIVVRDTREVGYYGAVGAKGACKIRFTSTGTRFGEIIDLECP